SPPASTAAARRDWARVTCRRHDTTHSSPCRWIRLPDSALPAPAPPLQSRPPSSPPRRDSPDAYAQLLVLPDVCGRSAGSIFTAFVQADESDTLVRPRPSD